MNIISKGNNDGLESGQDINRNGRIIRINAAIMCIYFLALLITFLGYQNYATVYFSIPYFLVFCILFCVSYQVKPPRLLCLYYIAVMAFMIGYVIVFGWNCGFQYFIFVLITILFSTGYGSRRKNTIYTMFLIVICLLLYLYTGTYRPVCRIIPATVDFFKAITFIAAVTAVFFTMSIRSDEIRDNFNKLVFAEEKLEDIKSRDFLTGLPNRRTIMQYIENLTEQRKAESNNRICVAIGDIDLFSKMNDRYGHDCGDILIKQLSYQLQLCLDGKCKIARWGGSQFLLVFVDASGEDAYYYLTKAQQHIRDVDFTWKDENITLTMTYGLMEYNPEKSIDYCIVEADKKMLMGKEAGRNTIIF